MGWFSKQPASDDAPEAEKGAATAQDAAKKVPPAAKVEHGFKQFKQDPARFAQETAEEEANYVLEALKKLQGNIHFSQEDIGPAIGQLSIGSLGGFAAGFALKRIGKLAAFGIGTVFVIMQGLSYTGYVHINWRAIERDYVRLADLDGDGTVTGRDAELAADRLAHMVKHNIPSGVGFTMGMLTGMGSSAGTAGKAGLVYAVGARLLLTRLAMAGAGGVATVGLPGILVDIQEKMGWRTSHDVSIQKEDIFWETLQHINDKKALKSMKDSIDVEMKVIRKTLDERVAKMDEKKQMLDDLFAQDDWEPADRASVDNLQESMHSKIARERRLTEEEIAEVKKKWDAVEERLQQVRGSSWWPF
ncbi:FUN14 domain-containing protein 1 [Porphyridium purpureum]|uniref:FUN14 domain-containing protein 1 n=1 Tax=Porphyridium purpureum TaxID=35688 RepID=A0A5J4Z1B6_PORPP|nr:FUN14 domain-containing protein 1 [Porphyridium purpureum]|eukprot:POR6792..scf208_2